MRELKQILLVISIISCSLAQVLQIPLTRTPINDKFESQNKKLTNFLSSLPNFSGERLINNSQMSYTGNIQVGNGKRTYSVVFDTGSNTLWLPSNNCVNSYQCDGFSNSYTCSASDGCTNTGKSYDIAYGKGYVKGFISSVQLSVCGLNSVESKILLIDESKDNKNMGADGLLGLGVYEELNDNGNAFVTNLKNNNIINEAMFSFYLGFKKGDSELVFGGFNPKKIQNITEIYYHPVIMTRKDNNQRWALAMTEFKFSSFSKIYNGNIGIVDSGTSLIIVSNQVFFDLAQFMVTNYKANISLDGFIYLDCSVDLPDLKFTLADTQGVIREYSIPQSFYTLQSNNKCAIMVQGQDMNDVAIILGDVFMRRYVSIFTHGTNSTVGLSQSIADPSDDYTQGLATWIIALIIIGVILVVGIIGYVMYRMCKSRSNEDRNSLNQRLLFSGTGQRIGGNNQNQNQQNHHAGQGVRIGGDQQNPRYNQ